MTKFSDEDVKHDALLANLPLSPKEIQKFKKHLSEVISYFEELKKVDTSTVEPTNQTTGLSDVFRPDETDPQYSLSKDEALSEANKIHNDFFKVPGILNKE